SLTDRASDYGSEGWGFESLRARSVMSQDIVNGRTPQLRGFTRFSSVGAGGVEGVLGQDVAGVGVDDGGLVVVDEADDLGAGVGWADVEVGQASAVAEADVSDAGRRCRNARFRGSGRAGAFVAHVRTTGREEGVALLDDLVAALVLAARDHGLVTGPQR